MKLKSKLGTTCSMTMARHSRTLYTVRLLLLLVLLTLPAVVQAQFNYTTDNGTITITGYTGPDGAVTIPTTINGLPVISIGGYAFQYNTNLTSVTIPNSVISIGVGAFYDCTSLTEVTLGNSVTSIENAAFRNCTSLSAITVDALNSAYSSVDGVLFNKSQTTLIQYPGGKAGSYTIPNSVADIGSAFYGCSSLTSVTIPNSVTNIENSAFGNCTSLTSVTLGNSVTYIDDFAFFGCTSLTNVTIPNSVTSIGSYGFSFCTNLTGVYFQGNAPSVGSFVFEDGNQPIVYSSQVTVYYLPGTTGWDATFAGRPTAQWLPEARTRDADFGVRTNQFGFNIRWASDKVVVVEASPNLSNPLWTPVSTNTLTGGSSYFSDPQWTNHPTRFYRLRSP